MKISLASNQFFDNQGYPLVAGRVSVFLHESNNPATIYTLEGDQFVEAQNPFILDEGGRCPTGSVWFDATVVDVKVEKYNGVPGSYSQLDYYEDGFDLPDVTNESVVIGIEGLANANTQLGVVSVVGYNNAHDCGERMFVWDPNCTADADGGAIVASDSAENGRWILLSDSRYMPSSYYGIVPGSGESNISAFLTYPEQVGQWSIKLPPVPRFKKGTYTSSGTMSTPKTIAFDTGAKFTGITFTCLSAEVMFNSDYVADFLFTEQARAESSWFRSAKAFWKCQARELHQSRVNHFADADLGNYGTICAIVQNQRITGTPMTVTGSANLQFNHCNFDSYSLSTAWFTTFKNCDFSDRWFADSAWDFGTTVASHQVVKNTENRIVLDNFADANVFVLQQAANGVTSLDLQNRIVDTISAAMPFTLVRNAVIGYAHFAHDASLENCAISNLYLEDSSLSFSTKNCTMNLMQAEFAAWGDTGSSIVLGCNVDTTASTLNFKDTSLNLNTLKVGRTTDDLSLQQQPVFYGCSIANGKIASSAPVLLGCNITDTEIYVYPSAFVEDPVTLRVSWTVAMELRGNRFNGSSQVKIGGHNGITDHLQEIYECRVTSIAVTDNVFSTSSIGITCPFWAGPGLAFRFIRGMTTFDNSDATVMDGSWFNVPYVYQGNTGNCPKAYGSTTQTGGTGIAFASNWISDGAFTGLCVCTTALSEYVFALPVLANDSRDPMNDIAVENSVYTIDKRCVTAPYKARAVPVAADYWHAADFPAMAYIPCCAWDRSLPNDMFYCKVGALSNIAQIEGIYPICANQ